MKLVDETLFEGGGARERHPGEKFRIEAQHDDDDSGKDRDA